MLSLAPAQGCWPAERMSSSEPGHALPVKPTWVPQRGCAAMHPRLHSRRRDIHSHSRASRRKDLAVQGMVDVNSGGAGEGRAKETSTEGSGGREGADRKEFHSPPHGGRRKLVAPLVGKPPPPSTTVVSGRSRMLQPLNGRVAFVGGAGCNRRQRQPLVLGPFSIQCCQFSSCSFFCGPVPIDPSVPYFIVDPLFWR